MKLIFKYTAKIHLLNLLKTSAILCLMFVIIDSSSNSSEKIYYSILRSTIALDSFFIFIAAIASYLTVIHFKKTSEDVAFMSIGYSSKSFFNAISLVTICVYLMYLLIIHHFAIELFSEYSKKNIQNCIFDTTTKSVNQGILKLETIKYFGCDNFYPIEEFSSSKDILNEDSKIEISLYNKLTNSGSKNSINTDFFNNDVKTTNKLISSSKYLQKIRQIDEYRANMKDNYVSIYKMIYWLIHKNEGIVSKSEILDNLMKKVQTCIIIVLFTKIMYFVQICHKRSNMVTSMSIKLFVFVLVYYITSHIISEKLLYSNIFLLKLFWFCIFNGILIFILNQFQYKLTGIKIPRFNITRLQIKSNRL